jgi:2-keto-4-pentenoate hydratase/2-oxohepta-3-ene-1,7-dioic acid hydratase in catechol pathway
MKLATVKADGAECAALVAGGEALILGRASCDLAVPVVTILSSDGLLAEARRVTARAAEDLDFADEHSLPFDEVELLAPIPRPGKVLCLGLNYRDHAAESGAPVPSEPVIFSKASSSVIGPGDAIRLPACSDQVDYEVELAFVIGRPAKNVTAADAMKHVAGYTVLNDVTARDYQRIRGGGQWTLAKSFDTFCPIGPWVVTADEVADPHALRLECAVSGEKMQSSSTSQMIFTIPEIIEHLSAALTLEPGDLVGTGTPPGVGFARTPPRFLRAGDVVECTVEDVGTLVNPVEA